MAESVKKGAHIVLIVSIWSICFCPTQKRRDLLTPQSRHWYALTGTLSGTPDRGVPRTVSCKSKLPVLDWTAAEAANLLLNCLNHIRLFRDIPELKAQVRSLCKRQFLPTFHRGVHRLHSQHGGQQTLMTGGQAIAQSGAKRRVTLARPCPSCRLRKARQASCQPRACFAANGKSVAPCRRPVTRPATANRILVRVWSLARARSSHRANRNRRNPAPAAIAA